MKDICVFIPQESNTLDIDFLHFVYETGLKKLKQPFVHSVFYLQLVFKGEGVLKVEETEFPLKKGDIFFTFPHQKYSIIADENFTFMYITFTGSRAKKLLDSLQIGKQSCVFKGNESINKFWHETIIMANQNNSSLLAESVFTYTLSHLSNTLTSKQATKDKIDLILDYLKNNFSNKDISIKKVADLFFYNEKYLSAVFIKKTGIKFSEYVNILRIKYAKSLLEKGEYSIAEISDKCGFSDQFYFSRVFKKIEKLSPNDYLKKYKISAPR